ncbi:hypothetical protein VPMS16_614 [Vibrio sp. 16]|nr:hypothetical protein VPMS16_614 [Vibrio sp. 16]
MTQVISQHENRYDMSQIVKNLYTVHMITAGLRIQLMLGFTP